jgi:hypothetical protein
MRCRRNGVLMPNLKPTYICTHVVKDIEEDIYEEGLSNDHDGDVDYTPIDQKVHITADSLPELMVMIGNKYRITIDQVTFPPAQEEHPDDVTELNYHRQEDPDGDPPTSRQTNCWKAGEEKQYYATYRFTIKRVMVIPMTRDEISGMLEIDE